MPVFIDHLRTEIGTIEAGLQQLETFRSELAGTHQVRLGDMRLTLYGLNLVFMRSYLPKVATILIPALENSILPLEVSSSVILDRAKACHEAANYELPRLLIEIDSSYGRFDPQALCVRLNDYIQNSFQLVDFELNTLFPWAEERLTGLEQERLLTHALDLDRVHGFERVRGTQILMNALRTAAG